MNPQSQSIPLARDFLNFRDIRRTSPGDALARTFRIVGMFRIHLRKIRLTLSTNIHSHDFQRDKHRRSLANIILKKPTAIQQLGIIKMMR